MNCVMGQAEVVVRTKNEIGRSTLTWPRKRSALLTSNITTKTELLSRSLDRYRTDATHSQTSRRTTPITPVHHGPLLHPHPKSPVRAPSATLPPPLTPYVRGKTRLAKWYSGYNDDEKIKLKGEVHRLVAPRDQKHQSNFVEFRGSSKIVYRRYAGLFFCACVDANDNELAYLEAIHFFVEVLDQFFGNVCELDLVFNFYKVSRSDTWGKIGGAIDDGKTGICDSG